MISKTDSIELHDRKFQLLFDKSQIDKRVQELAESIKIKFKDQRPLFIGVLNGSFIFTSDLVRAYHGECEVTFVKLNSYEGMDSTGRIEEQLSLKENIKGRPIIIVEDIIDSGRTVHHFLKSIQSKNPSSVSVATLLYKPKAMQFDYNIDYIGFEIPNQFVVGYGLDYDGLGRQLDGVYVLEES